MGAELKAAVLNGETQPPKEKDFPAPGEFLRWKNARWDFPGIRCRAAFAGAAMCSAGPPMRRLSFELLDAFLDQGSIWSYRLHLFELGAGPKGGETETIIGRWMKPNGTRDKVIFRHQAGQVGRKRRGSNPPIHFSQ